MKCSQTGFWPSNCCIVEKYHRLKIIDTCFIIDIYIHILWFVFPFLFIQEIYKIVYYISFGLKKKIMKEMCFEQREIIWNRFWRRLMLSVSFNDSQIFFEREFMWISVDFNNFEMIYWIFDKILAFSFEIYLRLLIKYLEISCSTLLRFSNICGKTLEQVKFWHEAIVENMDAILSLVSDLKKTFYLRHF